MFAVRQSWSLILLLLVGCLQTASGQTLGSPYIFTKISTQEGLASTAVHWITQDRRGFMWIATNNGLQRYDGQRFLNFQRDLNRTLTLPSDLVGAVVQDDHSEELWVATDNGIMRLHSRLFTMREIPVNRPVPSSFGLFDFHKDRLNRAWAVLLRQGLFLFDSTKQSFELFDLTKLGFQGIPFSIRHDRRRDLHWIGTDSGLVVLDLEKKRLYKRGDNPLNLPVLDDPKLLNCAITGFMQDAQDRIWISTWKTTAPGQAGPKYFLYEPLLRETRELPYQQGDENYSFWEDSKGQIWIGGRNFYRYNDVTREREKIMPRPDLPFSIDYGNVNYIREDREHNLWVATDKGLYYFNPEQQKISYKTLRTKEGEVLINSVNSFMQTRSGRIFCTTWGNGLFELDGNLNQLRNIRPASMDANFLLAWCLLEDRQGKIWVGAQLGRLWTYDPASGKIKLIEDSAFDHRTIRAMVEDEDGNIWFGTQHGLIIKHDPLTGTYTRYSDSLYPRQEIYGNINKMILDREGRLWAATNNYGLIEIDRRTGKLRRSFQSDGLPGGITSSNLSDLRWVNDTTYMIGSSEGVNFFNPDNSEFRRITRLEGLPANSVGSVIQDHKGHYWFALARDLVRYKPENNQFTVFDERDGVVNNNFYSGSLYQLQDNRILLGANQGYLFFHPDQIGGEEQPPNVIITGMRIMDQPIIVDSILQADNNQVRLNHRQNFLSVEYASLSFASGDKLLYEYQMEGVDEEWVNAENRRVARYTNLPGGNYTFRVRARNPSGVYSPDITELRIRILPPFYQRWWFHALLALFLAGMAYLIHRLRVNQILSMEKVRSRIARDLHDDMGSTLSTINILSEMAKMKINKDVDKTQEYINKISDNSARMMEAMDDIVWSINPMNDSMKKITARMREFASGVLEARDIDYTFHVEEQVNQLKLDMEGRRDFFLIFKEAVNNLAKYSDCDKARIDISIRQGRLHMEIGDNGRGFDVGSADSGNGLTNMQKRAQGLRGKLQIQSQPGSGTQVTLDMPVG